MRDEVLAAGQDPVAAVAARGALHAAQVGPGGGLGHGQRVEALAARSREQIALPLLLVAGHQDSGRPTPEHAERHRRSAEFALEQGERQVIEAAAAHFDGQVRGVETQLDDLPLDLFAEFPRHAPATLDLLLKGIELLFDEVADRVHDHLLLGCECEVQCVILSAAALAAPRPSGALRPGGALRPRPASGRRRSRSG